MKLRRVALTLVLGFCACATSDTRVTVRVIEGRAQESRYVSPGAYEAYMRAQLALTRGDAATAVHKLREALAFDGDSPHLHATLARALASLGRRKEARAHLAEALRRRPGFPEALVLRGEIARAEGDSAKAEASYLAAITAAPAEPAAYRRLADLLERRGDVAVARRWLVRLVKRTRDREGYRQLALLCLRRLDLGCAASSNRELLKGVSDLRTLLQLARIERARGRYAAAIRLAREAFDRSGGNVEIASLLVDLLRHRGDKQGVEDLLGVLERQAGDDGTRLALICELHLDAKRPAAALALAERALRARPKAAALHVARAKALAKLGRVAEAKPELAKQLAGKQGSWAALNLAYLHEKARDGARAVAVLKGALGRDKDNPELLRAISRALFDLGRRDESVRVVGEALGRQRKSTRLVFVYAIALERAGRWREAVRRMKQLARAEPQNAAAHNFVGYLLADHNEQLAAAKKAIDKALFLDPGKAYAIDSLGWLWYRRSKLARARSLLRIALRLDPDEAEIAAHLAEVTAASGLLAEAVKLYRRAASNSEDRRLAERWREKARKLERVMKARLRR